MSNQELILVGTASALMLGAAAYLAVTLVRSRSIDTPPSGNGRPLRLLIGAAGCFSFLSGVASFAAEATDPHPKWNRLVIQLLLVASMLGFSAASIRFTVVARKLQSK